jgi:hypothetical protein
VRNKPNFPAVEIPPTIQTRCLSCETNPISPVGQGPGERNVRNEPNLACCVGAAEGQMCKTKPISARIKMRKTNPICPRRAGKTIAKASGLDDATPQGTNAQNEPNFHGGRSRHAEPVVRNKANSSQAARRASPLWKGSYGELDIQDASAKQSQFPRGQEGRGLESLAVPVARQSVRNEANFGRDQMCKTKPICPRACRKGPGSASLLVPRAGGNVQNEANSRRSGPGDRSGIRTRMAARPDQPGLARIRLPPTPRAGSLVVAGSDGPMPRGCRANSVQWGYSWFQDGYQRMPD